MVDFEFTYLRLPQLETGFVTSDISYSGLLCVIWGPRRTLGEILLGANMQRGRVGIYLFPPERNGVGINVIL